MKKVCVTTGSFKIFSTSGDEWHMCLTHVCTASPKLQSLPCHQTRHRLPQQHRDTGIHASCPTLQLRWLCPCSLLGVLTSKLCLGIVWESCQNYIRDHSLNIGTWTIECWRLEWRPVRPHSVHELTNCFGVLFDLHPSFTKFSFYLCEWK